MAGFADVDWGTATVKAILACSLALGAVATPALAAPAEGAAPAPLDRKAAEERIPRQLDDEQATGYRTVFAAIRESRWQDAQLALDGMKPGPLHAIARAEMLTAKGSPRAELDPLMKLLAEAPELPQAQQIAALAKRRGASDLPQLPELQRLSWIDGAPVRKRVRSLVAGDMTAAELAIKMQPFVKADDGASAQALLESTEGLSPDSITEWQQKIAWMYFLSGDDNNARAMAAKAATGGGDWATQARWTGALAAWRQNDCKAAGSAFEDVAARAGDVEMRAAGLYWAARADMACGRPDLVEPRLKNAAQLNETFYGLLARQSLGIQEKPRPAERHVAADWQLLSRRPNVRVAAALVEIDEDDLADEVLRQQARLSDPAEFSALTRLAGALDLPSTVVWLSHNGPAGITPTVASRYPAPNWTPDGGWRVDKALVYAHTLQESRFRTRVVSPAGAYGLMQVMPAAALDIARKQGRAFDKAMLSRPSVNMEVGQSYLEQLRDQPCTEGLLPKVIAAYNAGPLPVQNWNALARDGGDPLLYIESIPYWETRGYVVTVLRNYWMYEGQTGKLASPSRTALAQGMWPRFPGLAGPPAVRLTKSANGTKVASAGNAAASAN